MTPSDPLPSSVEQVVETYLGLLHDGGMPLLRGLYLVGSVALDDFRPGASDIDFLAILDEAPTAEECEALARVHGALAKSEGPHFDGFYLRAAELRQPVADYAIVPFSLDGRFRTGEICREINPVVWRCLARSGRVVLGAPRAELGIAEDEDLIRAYQVGNLRTYWQPWIEQAGTALAAKARGEGCNAGALAWGVLGVSRIACGLATGEVVSKKGAGHFALASQPARWHGVIREALSAHAGEMEFCSIETVLEGLAYMRVVIGEAVADQAETREPRFLTDANP